MRHSLPKFHPVPETVLFSGNFLDAKDTEQFHGVTLQQQARRRRCISGLCRKRLYAPDGFAVAEDPQNNPLT